VEEEYLCYLLVRVKHLDVDVDGIYAMKPVVSCGIPKSFWNLWRGMVNALISDYLKNPYDFPPPKIDVGGAALL
jgi:hypothetical protein